MNRRSILTRDDYTGYLLSLWFPGEGDILDQCVTRGYRDISLTLRGISKVEDRGALDAEALSIVRDRLVALTNLGVGISTQTAYDTWHRASCETLVAAYRARGYDRFRLGQAQRWLNLAQRYLYVMGEERAPGYGEVYPLCHIPLDASLLEQLARFGFKGLSSPWNQLDDYDEYLRCQAWVRARFTLVPLDVEMLLWLEQKRPGAHGRSGVSL